MENMAEKASEIAENKKLLRKTVRAELKNWWAANDASEASARACEKILALDAYKNAETVLAYIPAKYEADCLPVVSAALAAGKTVAVPRVGAAGSMDFFVLKNEPLENQLESGAFGILEPKKELELFDIDFPVPADISADGDVLFMIVPCLAFTADGKRLGKGKGFYDRYLERLMQAGLKAFLCGLCLPCQIVDDIPCDVFDRKVDAVIC